MGTRQPTNAFCCTAVALIAGAVTAYGQPQDVAFVGTGVSIAFQNSGNGTASAGVSVSFQNAGGYTVAQGVSISFANASSTVLPWLTVPTSEHSATNKSSSL